MNNDTIRFICDDIVDAGVHLAEVRDGIREGICSDKELKEALRVEQVHKNRLKLYCRCYEYDRLIKEVGQEIRERRK